MGASQPNQGVGHRIYCMIRVWMVLLCVLGLLALAGFLFLRLYGVPQPLLREVVARANARGIPVDLDELRLTLRGWCAANVRCYSAHPDDLEPLFSARQVYILRGKVDVGSDRSSEFKIEAEGLRWTPSVCWGVQIPSENPACSVERLAARVRFSKETIHVADATADWLGFTFTLNGAIHRVDESQQIRSSSEIRQFVSAEQFHAWSTCLRALELPDAGIDIDFSIDAAAIEKSSVVFALKARNPRFRGVGFSSFTLSGSYRYPELVLDHAILEKNNRAFWVGGTYDHLAQVLEGTVRNAITSNQLLLLLPEKWAELLHRQEVQLKRIPRFTLSFGPESPDALLQNMVGTFTVDEGSYKQMELKSVQGRISSQGKRIELNDLKGEIQGQYYADVHRTALLGGRLSGEAFWDGELREFGVQAAANFDPRLLVRPLSISEVATNVISRFNFTGAPPEARVVVRANVDDWDTFYLRIEGIATDFSFQEVELSSINTTALYEKGVLALDPIAATQGARFVKGSTSVDFRRGEVHFDALSTMHPVDIEGAFCPQLELFGTQIKTEGNVRFSAKGIFDWKKMERTAFTAQVEADRTLLPIAACDRFSATVDGHGNRIDVHDSTFSLYGGKGTGSFSVDWNPQLTALPFTADIHVEQVDFRQFMAYLAPDEPPDVSGDMKANIVFQSDFSTNLLDNAIGAGSIRVRDGRLAELPLFAGFSRIMRKVFPNFSAFPITKLRSKFTISDGYISTRDAYFEGDLLSAEVKGTFNEKEGLDAELKVKVFRDSALGKVVRLLTDPLMRLLEIELKGTLEEPDWSLKRF